MDTRHLAMIFLADPERSRELADLLAADGVEAIPTASSDELYRVINQQRVDLVVIQNELGGFLSGLEILERLYNDLLRPATVLVAQMPGDVQPRASELGLDQVIRTTDGLSAVKSAALGLLSSAQHSAVAIPAPARQLVQESAHVRPLPQLIVKLSSYLDHETASMEDFARDIAVDPRITAELLKLTNSTAMGLRKKVTRVFDAVNLLGIRRTVSLVLSASVIDVQSKLLRELPESLRGWYNGRSVLIGSTASAFARRLDKVSPETAYIVGLLQDIGILVLGQRFGTRYTQTVDRVREIAQLRLEVCEQEDFRMTHAEVSAALLQKWGLPGSLVSMVLAHHCHDVAAGRPHAEARFLHVMQVGEAVANLSDLSSPQRHRLLQQLLGSYGPDKAEQCRACLAEAIAKTVESSQLFSVPVPDEPKMQQMLLRIAAEEADTEAAERLPDGRADEAGTADGSPAGGGGRLQPAPAAAAAPTRILVVDDDPSVVGIIKRTLAPLGLEVLSCSSVSEARLLAPSAVLVLCDMHLGEERGTDVIRALRSDGLRAPVIMISGDRSRNTVRECIEAGISDFLVKPFDGAALVSKLRKHLAPATAPRAAAL